MFVPSNTGNFRFELPKDFIPKDVSDRFMPIIQKMNNPFENANEFVSVTVKNISLPSLSQSLVSQTKRSPKMTLPATSFNYRSGQNPNSLVENKEISLSFIAAEGFLNYFIMMDTFFHYYNFARKSHYSPDFRVRILDLNGIETMHLIFRQVIFQGLEGLSFSYGDINENYAEFTASFSYSVLDLESKGSTKSTLNSGVVFKE